MKTSLVSFYIWTPEVSFISQTKIVQKQNIMLKKIDKIKLASRFLSSLSDILSTRTSYL